MKRRGGDDEKRTISRRGLLKAGAVLTGAALVGCGDDDAPAGPPSDAGVDAGSGTDAGGAAPDVQVGEDVTKPPPSTLSPVRGDGSHPFHYIDTLVLLQLENRSFDHYFGAMSLVDGREDVDGLAEGMSNPGPDGAPVPIRHLTTEWVIDVDPPHGHGSSLAQYNAGANDGFVTEYAKRLGAGEQHKLDWVMGYHTRDQLPATYGLAEAFTFFDRWHCSLLGPTWPNRFYSHCATSAGQTSNDKSIDAPNPYSPLVEQGVTVGTYHPGIYFLLLLESLGFDSYAAAWQDQFFEDAKNGALPNVTVLEPTFGFNDDHPPADIRLGQAFLQSVYEALRTSPQWDRTLLVVFYDEHGGFFDHVAPPLAQGEPLAAINPGLAHLGFRVPGFMVGPLVARGGLSHTLVEHASVSRLVSEIFGQSPINARAAMAADLGEALSLELVQDDRRPDPVVLPPVEVDARAFEMAAERPFSQPELAAAAVARGLGRQLKAAPRRRSLMRVLQHAERLGAVRVR